MTNKITKIYIYRTEAQTRNSYLLADSRLLFFTVKLHNYKCVTSQAYLLTGT